MVVMPESNSRDNSTQNNKNQKLIFDNQGKLLAFAGGNTLPTDKSHCHLSDISIQRKAKKDSHTAVAMS